MTKEVPRTSVLRDEELIAYLRLQGLDKDIAAADRIEALLAERDEAMQLLKTLSNMNGDLSRDLYKTKLLLAKVVEALEMYACDPECADGKCYDTGDSCGQFATATLAEIKGEGREVPVR